MKVADPKTESGLSFKVMEKKRAKAGSLEDKDPKAESRLSSKIMQKHANTGS